MRVVTNAEMAQIDSWAINKLGIPGIVLMENAGQGCVNVIEEYCDLSTIKALILCGKGNNGGDGFVIARYLANRGTSVQVILSGKGTTLKGDALTNYKLAKRAGILIHESIDKRTISRIWTSFNPEVVVDAIFGTGFRETPRGVYSTIIDMMNRSEAFILSVDIPSGVNGDDGQSEGVCVMADATATMCMPKRGHYLYPGRDMCGDLHVVDIGIPNTLIEKGYPRVPEFEDVLRMIPYRPSDGHKGTFGNVLVIAGARGFSGAAAMTAVSSLKTGAGLVRLAAPKGLMDALESKLLEVVKIPLPQTPEETISPRAIDTLEPYLDSDVIVIGPGITTHPQTAEFVQSLIPRIRVPVIIDADAINILADHKRLLKKLRAPSILTPHPGELHRLTKIMIDKINRNRIDLAPSIAKELKSVIVLKGAPTVTASPEGEIYVNPTGNSGLASAGSGDVLVGMISGFISQHVDLIEASAIGVFLHGLCAELAMDTNNEYGLTAGDLITYIPEAISYVIEGKFEEDAFHD